MITSANRSHFYSLNQVYHVRRLLRANIHLCKHADRHLLSYIPDGTVKPLAANSKPRGFHALLPVIKDTGFRSKISRSLWCISQGCYLTSLEVRTQTKKSKPALSTISYRSSKKSANIILSYNGGSTKTILSHGFFVKILGG